MTPTDGEPVRLAALAVSYEFLSMTGLRPLLGRGFTEAEDRPGAPEVAVIGEDLWERLFARDPAVIGRTLRFDDVPYTVVGVLPDGADFGTLQILSVADYSRSFADRGQGVEVEVWVPLRPDPESLPRSTHPIFVLGRLAPGAAPEDAQREMSAIAADLEKTFPENTARGVSLEPFREVVFGPIRPALLVLVGAVALVLLVACTNIANLLVARGAVRLREVAVRTALGAGWRRLVRQFLVEGALLRRPASCSASGSRTWASTCSWRSLPARSRGFPRWTSTRAFWGSPSPCPCWSPWAWAWSRRSRRGGPISRPRSRKRPGAARPAIRGAAACGPSWWWRSWRSRSCC